MFETNSGYGFFDDLEKQEEEIVQYVLKSNNVYHVRSYSVLSNATLPQPIVKHNTFPNYNSRSEQDKNCHKRNVGDNTPPDVPHKYGVPRAQHPHQTAIHVNTDYDVNNNDDDDEFVDIETSKTMKSIFIIFAVALYIILL